MNGFGSAAAAFHVRDRDHGDGFDDGFDHDFGGPSPLLALVSLCSDGGHDRDGCHHIPAVDDERNLRAWARLQWRLPSG